MNNKLILGLLLLVALASCTKKQGCTNPDSINYDYQAEVDNGSCYFKSDDLVGTWSVSDIWVGYNTPSGNMNYTITIEHEVGNFNLKVYNFAGLNPAEYVVITVSNSSTTIVVADKYIPDQSSLLWSVNTSQGSIVDYDSINFTYWLDSGASQKNGTMTCTKL